MVWQEKVPSQSIGRHLHVVELLPAVLKNRPPGTPVFQCLDCQLESEYFEEFLIRACGQQR